MRVPKTYMMGNRRRPVVGHRVRGNHLTLLVRVGRPDQHGRAHHVAISRNLNIKLGGESDAWVYKTTAGALRSLKRGAI